MQYSNPKLPEGVNLSKNNPLLEFLTMLLQVLLSVAAALGVAHLLLSWCLPMISFATEEKMAALLGDRLSNLEISETPLSEECQSKQQAIQALVDRLAAQQDLDPEINLKVHFVNHEDSNAFATLGGHIFILQGALDGVSSENGLALVLAHEIAHIKLRHPLTSLGRGLVSGVVLSMLGSSGSEIVALSGSALLLNFSREQEAEADRIAQETLLDYYGHLQGAAEFFQSALKQQTVTGHWLNVMGSHPDLQSRIDSMNGPKTGAVTAKSPALLASCP
jgi:predicted Zn-dependent protease